MILLLSVLIMMSFVSVLQHQNKLLVLKAMVESAAKWITAGLPLRVIKIVMYEAIPDKFSEEFAQLKKKIMTKNQVLKVVRSYIQSYLC